MPFYEQDNGDVVNIAVFGPGYGESIVIYIPGLGWGVVDSCTSKIKGIRSNPSLEYLKSKDVRRLAFIILSHPHEDHYLGLDQIIDHYLGRIERICYYSGDGLREYKQYLVKKEVLGSPDLRGLAAIFKKFEEAKNEGANIIRIAERTEIIRKTKYKNYEIEIIALSPSSESIRKYTELLFESIPKEDGDVLKPLSDSQHNLLSSAIWCSIGNLRLLLGSDVEIGDDEHTGWEGILRNADSPNLSSHLIKVPHHGSSNAFYEPAWEIFSQDTLPVSIITPYVKLLDPLPRESDLKQISKYSNFVAITSKAKTVKPKKIYDRTILKHLHGVRNWKCLLEDDQVGYVSLYLSIDTGSIVNLELVSQAYLYENEETTTTL